jgi:ABC-type ATPase involved in cell division
MYLSATPSNLYGCEIWKLKQRDIRTRKTEEMKFMRSRAGCIFSDHRRHEDILEELKVDSVEKKLAQYKQKCFNHICSMEDIGYPVQLLNYRSIG